MSTIQEKRKERKERKELQLVKAKYIERFHLAKDAYLKAVRAYFEADDEGRPDTAELLANADQLYDDFLFSLASATEYLVRDFIAEPPTRLLHEIDNHA